MRYFFSLHTCIFASVFFSDQRKLIFNKLALSGQLTKEITLNEMQKYEYSECYYISMIYRRIINLIPIDLLSPSTCFEFLEVNFGAKNLNSETENCHSKIISGNARAPEWAPHVRSAVRELKDAELNLLSRNQISSSTCDSVSKNR